MPTTRPAASASAPPELPGFSAASVWMTSSITRPTRAVRVGRERPRPLTTPAVTEPARPNGFPTATMSWPTCSWSASPRVAGAGVYPRARRTARSERGSAPITSTGVWVPSAKAAVPPAAPATTWALVRRNPSSVKTTADPAPSRRWPLRELPCTRSAATCGVSFAAIAVTTESTRRALSTLRNSRCRPCHLEEQPSQPPAYTITAQRLPVERYAADYSAVGISEALRMISPACRCWPSTGTFQRAGLGLWTSRRSTLASPRWSTRSTHCGQVWAAASWQPTMSGSGCSGSRKSSTSAGTCCANAPPSAVSVRIRAPRRPDRLRRSRATCSRSHHGCARPVVRRTTTRAAAALKDPSSEFRVPPTTLSAAAGSADLVQPADRRPVAGVPEALQLVVPRRTEQGVQTGGQRLAAPNRGQQHPQPVLADHDVAIGTDRRAEQAEGGRVAVPLAIHARIGVLGHLEAQQRPAAQGSREPAGRARSTAPRDLGPQRARGRWLVAPGQADSPAHAGRHRPLDVGGEGRRAGMDVEHATSRHQQPPSTRGAFPDVLATDTTNDAQPGRS